MIPAATELQLWARLKSAGLVQGEPPVTTEQASPWYVRTMLGIAGWIASLFLFGFVAVGFAAVMKSSIAMLVLGVLLCGGATALFRAVARNDFAAQFAFAVSLAGQILIVIGLGDAFSHRRLPVAAAMMAVEAALFLAIASPLHRVWTAAAGVYAARLTLYGLGLAAYTPALLIAAYVSVWINELKRPARGDLLRALGYGLALVILLTLIGQGNHWRWIWSIYSYGSGAPLGGLIGFRLGQALIGAVLVWTTVALLRREQVSVAAGPGLAAVILALMLAGLAFEAPGVALAVTMLMVGYGQGNRILTGLALFGLLAYLGQFYYNLNLTLLEKSAWLAGSGTLLLVARYTLSRWLPPTVMRETRHA